jgi:hypothetical protein
MRIGCGRPVSRSAESPARQAWSDDDGELKAASRIVTISAVPTSIATTVHRLALRFRRRRVARSLNGPEYARGEAIGST